MKKSTDILRDSEEFNRLISLPGWKNQKNESVTKEDILKKKSALRIRNYEDSYSILLTSGYWFSLIKK